MEELDIFPQSVLTQNKKIMMTKNLAVIKMIKKSKTIYKNKFNKKKKKFYSMEDSEDEEKSENEEIIFMGIGTQTSYDESHVEGEVDLQVEIISSLEEIEKCRRRNKSLKEQLSKYKEEKKSKEEEFKTLQEELHNSRQQMMVSMKEVKRSKLEVGNLKGEVKMLKYQQTINEKFRERTKTQDSKTLEA